MSDTAPTADEARLPIAPRTIWKVFLAVALGLAAVGAYALEDAALHYVGVPTTGTVVSKSDRVGKVGREYVIRVGYADGGGGRHEFGQSTDRANYDRTVPGTTAVPVRYNRLIPSHATQTGEFDGGPVEAFVAGLALLAAAVPCAVVGARDLHAGWRAGLAK